MSNYEGYLDDIVKSIIKGTEMPEESDNPYPEEDDN